MKGDERIRTAVCAPGADSAYDPRLILCENCGKPLAKHCKSHWVSGPHCVRCTDDGSVWTQGGAAS